MKKKFLTIIPLFLLCLAGCSNNNGSTSSSEKISSSGETSSSSSFTPIGSDSLYVKKVKNLSDDFIMGMDASAVPSLEKSGVKYYNFEGKEADVYETLSLAGINYIRVRVWNDPFDKDGKGYGGGNCDINNAIEIGKRATAAHMKLIVNFHYSDFWADPSKQMVPKAWKSMDINAKSEALYQFTKDSLQKLRNEGVDIGMVQIGNETNGSMCGEKIWFNIASLMASGAKACREVVPNALIAVHFANPEKITNYQDYAKKLAYYELDYDVFGSSYYPYWHGTLDNLNSLLSEIATTYNKKVMVLETSYAFTLQDTDFYGNTIGDGGGVVQNYPYTIQGQANSVRDVVETVSKTTNGIGIVYWEGTWISVGTNSYEENAAKWEKYGSGWAASYAKDYDPNDAGRYYGGCAVDNQAFFDATGHPLESLKVFGLCKVGNVIDIKPDAIETVTIKVDLAVKPVLPTKVNAVMNDDSKQQVDVTWNVTDEELLDMQKHGPKVYTVKGVAGGMEATCYVNMIEFNYLVNDSFEEDANKTRVPKGWKVIETGKADELWVEDKSTDSPEGAGTKHYHFWSANTNTVNFNLEQDVKNLPDGKYKFSMSIMGGDAGNTDVYIYFKVNGELVATAPLSITSYNDWHTAWIKGIDIVSNDTVTVGIHVECEGAGNGAWGKIDASMLNSDK